MGRRVYLLDACVLIDMDLAGGRGFLRGTDRYIGAIRVADVIVDVETIGVSRTRCGRLGVGIVEIEADLASVAGIGRPDGVSYYDHLSFLLAKNNGWTLVTNDRRLRNHCEAEKVAHVWELELVLSMVSAGAMEPRDARRFGRALRAANNRITEELIRAFEEELDHHG